MGKDPLNRASIGQSGWLTTLAKPLLAWLICGKKARRFTVLCEVFPPGCGCHGAKAQDSFSTPTARLKPRPSTRLGGWSP